MNRIKVGGIEFNISDTNNQNHTNHWNYVNAGSWEPQTFKIFKQFLNSRYSYIDMGAWIGSTVLYGCQLAKHVYAVEPDTIALKALKSNIKNNLELIDKITLYEGCISDNVGKTFMEMKGNSESTIFGRSSDVEIESITFDVFVNRYNIVDCNFIKMDIEGAEGVVLPTMKEYLQEIKPTLYVSFHPRILNQQVWESIIDTVKQYSKFYEAQTMKEINIGDIKYKREVVMV